MKRKRPLPVWAEPPSGDGRPADPRPGYPYILITGARVPAFRHTENRQNPLLREQCPHPIAWLHPDVVEAVPGWGGRGEHQPGHPLGELLGGDGLRAHARPALPPAEGDVSP